MVLINKYQNIYYQKLKFLYIKMKFVHILLLVLVSSISTLTYTGHELVLNDAKSTIDGETVSSTPKNGVS